METVILIAKNKRQKQLIKEFGNIWVLVEERESVQVLNNNKGFLIHPINKPDRIRWVTEDNINNKGN